MQDDLSLRWAHMSEGITIKYLYNFDPLKHHFYIVKLVFTGVCIIFLISAQKHRLWVLVLTSTHNLCFEQKCENYQNFLSENFRFCVIKFSVCLNRLVFVMVRFLTLPLICSLNFSGRCRYKQNFTKYNRFVQLWKSHTHDI